MQQWNLEKNQVTHERSIDKFTYTCGSKNSDWGEFEQEVCLNLKLQCESKVMLEMDNSALCTLVGTSSGNLNYNIHNEKFGSQKRK